MIAQVLKTSTMSLGIGFLLQLMQSSLNTDYLNKFLSLNLITILIALLAINSATLGIVLTKIRDLVEKHGNAECFQSTKSHMILSIKEQIALIILSVLLLTVMDANVFPNNKELNLLLKSMVTGVFAYSLFVLYDTAKSVLVIIDFEFNK